MSGMVAAIVCSLSIIIVVFFMHVVSVTLDALKDVMDVIVELKERIDEMER